MASGKVVRGCLDFCIVIEIKILSWFEHRPAPNEGGAPYSIIALFVLDVTNPTLCPLRVCPWVRKFDLVPSLRGKIQNMCTQIQSPHE